MVTTGTQPVVLVTSCTFPSYDVPRRLIVKSDVFYSKFESKFGLLKRCDRSVVVLPSPGDPDNGSRLEWTEYKCRDFPTRVADKCDKENKDFCIAWTTAGYLTEMGALMAVVASLAIVFGVTTHSRRRRIWRVVAWFVAFHSEFIRPQRCRCDLPWF